MRRAALGLVFLPALLQGAFEERPFSARAAGLGGAMTAVVADPAAAYYNPAGLAFAERASLTTGYTRLFGMEGMGYGSLAGVMPTERRGAWGFIASDFGDSLYREREIGASWAFRPTPEAALGLGVKGQSLEVQRYGSASAAQVDVGAAGRLFMRLDAGISLRNITASRLGKTGEAPPAVFAAGLALKAWGEGPAVLSVHQESGGQTAWHLGQELRPHPAFAFRIGFETEPNRLALGMGVRKAGLEVDYALLSHPIFADQHQFSLSYHWR